MTKKFSENIQRPNKLIGALAKEKSTRKEDLTKRICKKSKGGIFCDVCNKKLRSRYHLKLHMTVHTGEKNYICGICKKAYQQKWNLITHVARVHSKEKPFKCNDCGKAFGYSSHFKRHVKTHFLEKIEIPETVKKRILNPHKCEFCEKSFETKYRLDQHTRVHTGTRPYVCDKCGKSFTTKRLCKFHMIKKHEQESHFECEHCKHTFPDRSSIVLHLKTEHDVGYLVENETSKDDAQIFRIVETMSAQPQRELVPCEVCGKTVTRGSIQKHLNVHYRNRIYSCRYCKKEFLESGQRRVHERKHTGEKPYLCDVCGRGHAQYGNLSTHKKRYHNLRGKSPKVWKSEATFSTNKISNENHGNNGSEGFSESFSENSQTTELSDFNKTIVTSRLKENGSERLRESEESCSGEVNSLIETANSNQDLIKADEGSSKSTFVLDPKPDTKSKCTGNETIEEFLKIASTWVDKKFNESKHKNFRFEKSCNLETSPPLTRLRKQKTAEKIEDESSEPTDQVSESEFSDELTPNTTEKEPENSYWDTQENKNLAKEVKRKMNKIMFEKIVESLKNGSSSSKVLQVVDKVKETVKEKGTDILKEFLKQMKSVPDNAVMKTEAGVLFWHCWMCDSKLKTRYLLARHLLIHEPSENRPYRCDICHKTFTQSNNFKEHTMSHNNENQYCCEICGSGFRHKSHFNLHMRRHDPATAKSGLKKYECSYCGKKLHTNYQRAEHERTHTKEKPFLCKDCGQQFGALSTLHRHKSIHTNANHQCQICLKIFRQKSSLKRHQKTHSGFPDERVSCECGKTFSQTPSLKKHKLICKKIVGLVVKPFHCLVCSKRFLTKSDLKRHIATHDPSKRFKCSLCSIYLKTDETFKRHMRRHEESRTEFPCNDCQSVFYDVTTLSKHIVKAHLKIKQNI